MIHPLKTDPEPYEAVRLGFKTFEIRRADRSYAIRDFLLLKETQHTGAAMAAGAPLVYTGRELWVYVTHILTGPAYGLAEGFVIMSVRLC